MNIMDSRIPLPQGTKLYFDENCFYTIDQILGYGGSAIIYSAYRTVNGVNSSVKYAIKECYPCGDNYTRMNGVVDIVEDDDEAIESFERTKKLLVNEMKYGWEVGANNAFAEVLHEQLAIRKIEVPQGDVYTDTNKGLFFCMMSLEGKGYTLDQVLEHYDAKEELTLNLCLQIINKILTAVDKLHRRAEVQYMHGDIHPNNIFFIGTEFEKNELGICSLLDFACVRRLNEETKMTDAVVGDIYTTESYTAPEISRWIQGEEIYLSAATDIYSLGMLFWYILNGGRYKGARLKYRKPYLLPGSAKKLNAKNFAAHVNKILSIATATEPQSRYYDANDMQKAIGILLKDTTPLVHRVNAEIPYPTDFGNRKNDLKNIETIMEKRNNPLFLWGMGGIGKTILASMYGQKMKTGGQEVVFLTYKNSIKETILSLHISGDNEWESNGEALNTEEVIYKKKLGYLSQYRSNSLLIIDDFYDENRDLGEMKADDNYQDLLLLDIKLLITTRYECNPEEGYYVARMSDEELLLLLKRRINIDEAKNEIKLRNLIECVSGNTYMLELIGTALSEDALELDEAISVIQEGSKQVKASTGKDLDFVPKSIDEQMEILFEINVLDNNEKRVLVHSLIFPPTGMKGRMFLACEKLFSYELWEAAKKVVRKSWIIKNQELGTYMLHPTVRTLINKKCTNIEAEMITFLGKLSLLLESKGISAVTYREYYSKVFDSAYVLKSRNLFDFMYAFANGYYAVARKEWDDVGNCLTNVFNYVNVFEVVCEIWVRANSKLQDYQYGISGLKIVADKIYGVDHDIDENLCRIIHRYIFEIVECMTVPDAFSIFSKYGWVYSEEECGQLREYDVWRKKILAWYDLNFSMESSSNPWDNLEFDKVREEVKLYDESEWMEDLVSALISENIESMSKFLANYFEQLPMPLYNYLALILEVRKKTANVKYLKKLSDVLKNVISEEPGIMYSIGKKICELPELKDRVIKIKSFGGKLAQKLDGHIIFWIAVGYRMLLQAEEFDYRELVINIIEACNPNIPEEYVDICVLYYKLSRECIGKEYIDNRKDNCYGKIFDILNDYEKFSIPQLYLSIANEYWTRTHVCKCLYENAIYYYYQAKKSCINKDVTYAFCCENMGRVYSDFRINMPQEALREYMEAYSVYRQIKDSSTAECGVKCAEILIQRGEQEKGILYYQESLKEYDNIHFDVYSDERRWFLNRIVDAYVLKNRQLDTSQYWDGESASDFAKEYAQTKDMRKSSENTKRLNELRYILGEHYRNCGRYGKAISKYREVDRDITCFSYFDLATCFHKEKLYQEEIECHKRALAELQNKIITESDNRLRIYFAIFYSSLMLKKYTDANIYSQKCAIIFEQEPIYFYLNDKLGYHANFLERIATVYQEVGVYQEAIDYYNKTVLLCNKVRTLFDIHTIANAYLSMGECYICLKDKKNAWECFMRFLNMEKGNHFEGKKLDFYNHCLKETNKPVFPRFEEYDGEIHKKLKEFYMEVLDDLIHVRNYGLASRYLYRMLDLLNASLKQKNVEFVFAFQLNYTGEDGQDFLSQLKELQIAYYNAGEYFQKNGYVKEHLDSRDTYNILLKYDYLIKDDELGLANYYIDMGKYMEKCNRSFEAKEYYVQALIIRIMELEPMDPDLAITYEYLISVCNKLGLADESANYNEMRMASINE